MKFYFCETCGKRITENDLAAGAARDKKLKGVYCKQCSMGVMTMENLPLTDDQARKILQTENKRASGSALPAAAPRRSESAIPKASRASGEADVPAHRVSIRRPAERRTSPVFLAGITVLITLLVAVLVSFSRSSSGPETAVTKSERSTPAPPRPPTQPEPVRAPAPPAPPATGPITPETNPPPDAPLLPPPNPEPPAPAKPIPSPAPTPSKKFDPALHQRWVPGLLGTYFENDHFAGAGIQRVDPSLDLDWQEGAPMPGLPVDHFSVRWQGRLRIGKAGQYVFHLDVDDRTQAFLLDGAPVLVGRIGLDQASPTFLLQPGDHELLIEFIEDGGEAHIKLVWECEHMPRQRVPPQAFVHDAALSNTAIQLAGAPAVPAATPAAPASVEAVFVGKDENTRGDWLSTYGGEGYFLPGFLGTARGDVTTTHPDLIKLPPYLAGFKRLANKVFTWLPDSEVPDALWAPDRDFRSLGSDYMNAPVQFLAPCIPQKQYRLSLYLFDVTFKNQPLKVELVDAAGKIVYDARELEKGAFTQGVYLTWDVRGEIQVRITGTDSSQYSCCGIFFDLPRSPGLEALAAALKEARLAWAANDSRRMTALNATLDQTPLNTLPGLRAAVRAALASKGGGQAPESAGKFGTLLLSGAAREAQAEVPSGNDLTAAYHACVDALGVLEADQANEPALAEIEALVKFARWETAYTKARDLLRKPPGGPLAAAQLARAREALAKARAGFEKSSRPEQAPIIAFKRRLPDGNLEILYDFMDPRQDQDFTFEGIQKPGEFQENGAEIRNRLRFTGDLSVSYEIASTGPPAAASVYNTLHLCLLGYKGYWRSNGQLKVWRSFQSELAPLAQAENVALSDSQWHKLEWSFTAATGKNSVSIDGKPVLSFVDPCAPASGYVYIGGEHNISGPKHGFRFRNLRMVGMPSFEGIDLLQRRQKFIVDFNQKFLAGQALGVFNAGDREFWETHRLDDWRWTGEAAQGRGHLALPGFAATNYELRFEMRGETSVQIGFVCRASKSVKYVVALNEKAVFALLVDVTTGQRIKAYKELATDGFAYHKFYILSKNRSLKVLMDETETLMEVNDVPPAATGFRFYTLQGKALLRNATLRYLP